MPKARPASNPRLHFFRRIRRHFGMDPARLVLVSQKYSAYDRPNIHLALEKLFSGKQIKAELEGIILIDHYEDVSLAKLSRQLTAQRFLPGPVEYRDVEVANGKSALRASGRDLLGEDGAIIGRAAHQ